MQSPRRSRHGRLVVEDPHVAGCPLRGRCGRALAEFPRLPTCHTCGKHTARGASACVIYLSRPSWCMAHTRPALSCLVANPSYHTWILLACLSPDLPSRVISEKDCSTIRQRCNSNEQIPGYCGHHRLSHIPDRRVHADLVCLWGARCTNADRPCAGQPFSLGY